MRVFLASAFLVRHLAHFILHDRTGTNVNCCRI